MRLTCLADQRGDGHGDGEIGLAGAGGADAEDEVVALDGFEVAALVDGLGRENLLAEAALLAAADQAAEGDFRIVGDDAEVAVEVAVVEDVAFLDELVVVVEDVLGAAYAGRLALDFEVAIHQAGVYGQARFEEPDVLVTSSEETLDAAADTYASFHGFGRLRRLSIQRGDAEARRKARSKMRRPGGSKPSAPIIATAVARLTTRWFRGCYGPMNSWTLRSGGDRGG